MKRCSRCESEAPAEALVCLDCGGIQMVSKKESLYEELTQLAPKVSRACQKVVALITNRQPAFEQQFDEWVEECRLENQAAEAEVAAEQLFEAEVAAAAQQHWNSRRDKALQVLALRSELTAAYKWFHELGRNGHIIDAPTSEESSVAHSEAAIAHAEAA